MERLTQVEILTNLNEMPDCKSLVAALENVPEKSRGSVLKMISNISTNGDVELRKDVQTRQDAEKMLIDSGDRKVVIAMDAFLNVLDHQDLAKARGLMSVGRER